MRNGLATPIIALARKFHRRWAETDSLIHTDLHRDGLNCCTICDRIAADLDAEMPRLVFFRDLIVGNRCDFGSDKVRLGIDSRRT